MRPAHVGIIIAGGVAVMLLIYAVIRGRSSASGSGPGQTRMEERMKQQMQSGAMGKKGGGPGGIGPGKMRYGYGGYPGPGKR